jgi:hypothetical protein
MSASREEIEFKTFVETKVEALKTLPVTPKIQTLLLNKLDWKNFERLCYRLVATEKNIDGIPHLYGVQGNDQKGIDIIAKKRIDGVLQTWCYQCNDYDYLTPSVFEKAL